MKIVPLNTPDLRNVPESLKRLAEQIQTGKEPNAIHAIVVAVDEFGTSLVSITLDTLDG